MQLSSGGKDKIKDTQTIDTSTGIFCCIPHLFLTFNFFLYMDILTCAIFISAGNYGVEIKLGRRKQHVWQMGYSNDPNMQKASESRKKCWRTAASLL